MMHKRGSPQPKAMRARLPSPRRRTRALAPRTHPRATPVNSLALFPRMHLCSNGEMAHHIAGKLTRLSGRTNLEVEARLAYFYQNGNRYCGSLIPSILERGAYFHAETIVHPKSYHHLISNFVNLMEQCTRRYRNFRCHTHHALTLDLNYSHGMRKSYHLPSLVSRCASHKDTLHSDRTFVSVSESAYDLILHACTEKYFHMPDLASECGTPTFARRKSRYSFYVGSLWRVDFTSVQQLFQPIYTDLRHLTTQLERLTPTHEVELELNGAVLAQHLQRHAQGKPNSLIPLLDALVGNARFLSNLESYTTSVYPIKLESVL